MIKNERTLIIGRSGCGKFFLMLSLLIGKKPDDVYTTCKTGNQYPSKYLNQSNQILTLEDYGIETIVFDDMLRLKEAKDFDAFFTRGRHQNLDIHFIFQSWYELPKKTIRNIPDAINRNMFALDLVYFVQIRYQSFKVFRHQVLA